LAKFSIKEIINAVKEYLNGNEGYHSIAQRIGVSRAVLRSWIRQYYHHGEQAFTKRYTN
jgi:transposase